MPTVNLEYTIELVVEGVEDDDEAKADVDKEIHRALERITGLVLKSQTIEEVDA